jgi:hypothetical protein
MVMDDIAVEVGGGGATHYDRPILLPFTLESYDGKYVTSPGRPGIPAKVPAWSQADEKKYLDLFIAELNEKLLAGLDPEPNLSRSSKRPAMYPAVRSSCIENIVFVGGSNARALSSAAASLGANSYNIARGGWKITRENVDKLIPDLKELMSGLPAGTPIVLFCMDNSSFLAASEEGGLVPISKCVEEDDGYHVNGALVVAPERSIQFSIEQLRRIISEFSEYILYIITPVTRYISMPCCDIPEHVTNFQDPDFLGQILADLTKLKFSLRKKLSPAVILDGIELVCGAGCSKERVEQTLRAGWASDPVHPNAHIYAKMALNLLEKVSAAGEVGKKAEAVRKRKRSESSSSSTVVNTQHPQIQQSQQYPSPQHGSRGSFRGPFRGRGRGRGWDATSSYSGGSYRSNDRGGGQPGRFQDRSGPHRGSGGRPSGPPRGHFRGQHWPRW